MTGAAIHLVDSKTGIENNLRDGMDIAASDDGDLGARVVALLTAFPGIETLAGLVAIDPTELNQSARIDYLSALERQSAWLQAVMQRAIVAVAGVEAYSPDKIWEGIDDAEREDVDAALRLSGSTAQMRIDVARTLVNHLPNTCSALAMGEISASHATVIAKETASQSAMVLANSQFIRLRKKHSPCRIPYSRPGRQ